MQLIPILVSLVTSSWVTAVTQKTISRSVSRKIPDSIPVRQLTLLGTLKRLDQRRLVHHITLHNLHASFREYALDSCHGRVRPRA